MLMSEVLADLSKDGIIMTAVMPGPIFVEKGYWFLKKKQNLNMLKNG